MFFIGQSSIILCFFSGLLVSLSGSLPLGNLNLMALHLASGGRIKKAVHFAIGAMLIEMLYLLATIMLIGFVLANKALFQTLQWAAVVLLLSLAAGSFRTAYLKRSKPNKLTDNALPGFVYGLMMSAVNPLQFPFWAGWVIYYLSNGLSLDSWFQKGMFIFGAGTGTFLALALFIFAGKLIAPFLQKRQRAVQFVFGCLFLTMAIFQVIIIL